MWYENEAVLPYALEQLAWILFVELSDGRQGG